MSDLSGVWSGSYAYPGSLEPVPFALELRDNGGMLSGEVSEPAPPDMPPGDVHAMLTGSHSGSRVSFTKIYDSLDHFLDPVHYDGTLDEDECEISGQWTISPTWSGSFVMTRPKPERAAAEVEETVEVDR